MVERDRVLEFLEKENRTAFVSPQQEKFVVIYDKESEDQDQKVIIDITRKLSKALGCSTFSSLVHDGDVFCYWLFENGKLVDEYNSTPDYFESETDQPVAPIGGNAKKLCSAFHKEESLSEVTRIFEIAKDTALNLSNDINDDLIGEEIHIELVKTLDMPLFAAEIGYYTIENNYLPSEFKKSSFTQIESI
ncbi:MAG: hypothetical protein JNK81_09625 [Anaerolineales bacterium]|nr:hypothetical protein [Anaerolineales bacterium]